jgi:mediator of RNA polymerase II transcription subunit 31
MAEEPKTSTPDDVETLIKSLPTRWEIELEFVQSLCNIQYLNYLAQQGYLNDESFINYLEYLNYWKQPKYAKFLVYPNCLHILTLLQHERFRMDIVNPDFRNNLMNDMVKRWQHVDVQDDQSQVQTNVTDSGASAGSGIGESVLGQNQVNTTALVSEANVVGVDNLSGAGSMSPDFANEDKRMAE